MAASDAQGVDAEEDAELPEHFFVRQTVVVRQGAPKRVSKWVDVVAAVVGFLLLASTWWLVEVLPDDEAIPPQFRVTFPVDEEEEFTREALFSEADPDTS